MSKPLWVDEYRPDELADIIGHDAVVRRMEQFVSESDMPNLLFAGRQGIGKTAIVHAFAREKYGDNWSNRLLELNASDDRGIDVVRDDIKEFARLGSGQHDFKVVFLDEADQLTNDAQSALRRTMEDYSDVTRFILSCNYPSQIIDPLQSRCAMMRLTPLTDEEVQRVLQRVADGEDLDATPDALERVAIAADGDARHAIHTLRLCVLDGGVTIEEANDMLGLVPGDEIDGIVDDALDGDFDSAMEALDSLLKEGVPVDRLLDELVWRVRRHDSLNPDARVKALDALGRADRGIRSGANPHVQLHAFVAALPLAKQSSTGGYTE